MVNGGQLNPGYNVTSKFFSLMKLPKQEGGRRANLHTQSWAPRVLLPARS